MLYFKGNHVNDSGPQQHPSNHNMMRSMCGPGNNGIIGLPNLGSGPMSPGMLINNSNPSMMGGPGNMMNQQGILVFKCVIFLYIYLDKHIVCFMF